MEVNGEDGGWVEYPVAIGAQKRKKSRSESGDNAIRIQ